MKDCGRRISYKAKKLIAIIFWVGTCLTLFSCTIISTTYDIGKGTVKTTYKTAKFVTKAGVATGSLAYDLGKFTFDVVTAPFDWPMTRDYETIDGLSPKEAVRQGRVKNSPYVINGTRYQPMSVDDARYYTEQGVASWYGYETYRQQGGRMTANGEAFDPHKPSAAHKFLPLPTNVLVTNLENGRSMILRVNDRGPFVRGRIIDVSADAAKRLGFYDQGTARVKVETIEID